MNPLLQPNVFNHALRQICREMLKKKVCQSLCIQKEKTTLHNLFFSLWTGAYLEQPMERRQVVQDKCKTIQKTFTALPQTDI